MSQNPYTEIYVKGLLNQIEILKKINALNQEKIKELENTIAKLKKLSNVQSNY